jgi:cell division protein FtsX
MRSDTETLIKALEILARDIQSDDGVANAAIAEAAQRLKEFNNDWHQPELCNEKYNELVIECNTWEELCEDLIEVIEDIPNLKKTQKDRSLIDKYYELKGHYKI